MKVSQAVNLVEVQSLKDWMARIQREVPAPKAKWGYEDYRTTVVALLEDASTSLEWAVQHLDSSWLRAAERELTAAQALVKLL